MGLKTRLMAVILAWFAAAGVQAESAVQVPFAQDFAREAKAAEAKKVPILVLFSRPDCRYCDQVLEEFLLPMQRNPEYRTKVIMLQVQVGGNAPLRDFAGKRTTHGRFARDHRVQLAPTIALFDAGGKELTEPLIGLTTPDYYGGFLDQRIDQALAKVRAKAD
jgi:thioredoxin-related protein